MELEVHDYQAIILRELLFSPTARFRDLNKTEATNDHFTFHLKRLIKEGLIEKIGTKYALTDLGKEFANRMDTDSLKMEKQGKIAVALHVVRENGKKTEYLIHQRLKEPFYGWYGSHSGKVRWGETPLEAAKRELLEETGLTGKFYLKGIVHVLHFHKDGRFLEDKYFWVFRIEDYESELMETVKEGKNIWMTSAQLKNLEHSFATYEELVEVVGSDKFLYVERRKVVDSY